MSSGSEEFAVFLTKSMGLRISEDWTTARFGCRLREDTELSFRSLTLQIYQAFYTPVDKKRWDSSQTDR